MVLNSLKDVRLVDLDTQTVVLVSKFVGTARSQKMTTLSLTDENVVIRAFLIGLNSENPRLRLLFLRLRRSLEQYLQSINGAEVVLPKFQQDVKAQFG